MTIIFQMLTKSCLALLITTSASIAQEQPPPTDAGHRVEVEFSKLTEYQCDELGSCSWRLECTAHEANSSAPPKRRLLEEESVTGSGYGRGIDLRKEDYVPFSDAPTDNVFEVSDFPVNVTCRVQEYDGFVGGGWEDFGEQTLTVNRCYDGQGFRFDNVDEGNVGVGFKIRARPRMLVQWRHDERNDYMAATTTINSGHNEAVLQDGFRFVKRIGWITHPKCIGSQEQPLWNWYSPSRRDNFVTTNPLWDPANYSNNRKTLWDGAEYRFVDVLGGVFKPGASTRQSDDNNFDRELIDLWNWGMNAETLPLNLRDHALVSSEIGIVTPPEGSSGSYVRLTHLDGRIVRPSLTIPEFQNKLP